jgi:excisionase family DNA binding protein
VTATGDQSSSVRPNATRGVRLADRLALRTKEAAEALGISEGTMRKLLPKLPVVREGGVVLIPVDPLREWLRKRAEDQGNRVDETVLGILNEIETDEDES